MLELELGYRPPLDWLPLLEFLAVRAVPGLESVADGRYRRIVRLGELVGSIEVSQAAADDSLRARLSPELEPERDECGRRLAALFDLKTAPEPIAERLGDDPLLGPSVESHPGLRVPGAWDPFELAVRAVLGQQVTVQGAVTLCSRLLSIYGRPIESDSEGVLRAFPSARVLSDADYVGVGLTGARAATLRALAAAVDAGDVPFGVEASHEEFVRALTALPGIGDWTAHYVAMRVRHDPDAFPASDLVLRKAAGRGTPLSARELSKLAEGWRPWRAYAAMHLWRSA